MVQKLAPANSGKVIIGLTGTFGSGKSTVAHLFQELGACVLSADAIAHEVLIPGGPHFKEVAALFPEALAAKSGALDRKKIAEIVFREPDRRKTLEAVAHPYVFQRFLDEINEAEEKVILLDVPLLFETGFNRFCDQTIVVKASEAVIQRRLLEKGFTEKEIKQRQNAQMSLEEKLKRANGVIDNSGTLEETKREVDQAWKRLHTLSKGEK